MSKLQTIEQLRQLRNSLQTERARKSIVVTVSGGTCGQTCGSLQLVEALRAELAAKELDDAVCLRLTGCHGFCEQEPIVIIEPPDVFYCRVSSDDAGEIVTRTIQSSRVIPRLLYTDPASGSKFTKETEIPFYRSQQRTLLSQHRFIDPCNIQDYIAIGGYSALEKVLQDLSCLEVIEQIEQSGLRGRGGAGYPTGRKWRQCRAAAGDEKYVICNADEGDPGAYMDRSLLESNPHSVLEGMLIGAYAIGAAEGFIYVRNEYPLAVKHARVAVDQARQLGLVGSHILGTPFCFEPEVVRGAGAFVCGESTALMASLQGQVGEPRPKDVHTTQQGLWQKPTNLNNVETWANVPLIINNGPCWFAARGTENSKGTKIFALTGHVRNTGLVEVEMGTPLRKIIYEIGGGPRDGQAIKAVQTGGPSGGCLPTEKFELPVDFETLTDAGSMVGSGGMVVMDRQTCMVDVAKYFLEFLLDESCGKCVPCRLGLSRLLEIVTDITQGRGRCEQIELLVELSKTMTETSLCALGRMAPNPVLSTLRYFRDEYDAHIYRKQCPAGVCRSLVHYEINPLNCTGCGACLKVCPYKAISGQAKRPHTIDANTCGKCGVCRDVCEFEAVTVR
jgi:NADH-quinone oxidoreductase subunit F